MKKLKDQFGDWTTEFLQNLNMAHRGQAYRHGKSFYRIGKKLTGRMLDGRTWDEYPTIAK